MKYAPVTIRTSLLTIVSLLCLSITALAGREVAGAWARFNDAKAVAASNRTSDLLLAAAGDWAVERGMVNAALAGKNPAETTTMASVKARRTKGDGAFDLALQQIAMAPDFKDRSTIVAEVGAAQRELLEARGQVDKALYDPLEERDGRLSAHWVSISTNLIMRSQHLRLASQYLPETIETKIDQIQDVKSAIWTMSEFAGRERALIGQAVSSGHVLDNERLQTLATYRGRVEQSWLEVSSFLQKGGVTPEMTAAADAVNQTFFGRFEKIRGKFMPLELQEHPIRSGPTSGSLTQRWPSTPCLLWLTALGTQRMRSQLRPRARLNCR